MNKEDKEYFEKWKDYMWWEKEENKQSIPLPVSIAEGDGYWNICTNSETAKLIGEHLHAVDFGETREEAIENFYESIKIQHEYTLMRMLDYERWVPFRVGPWKTIGGKWFAIFGITFHFRYGKDMKGGWYIPFTKLNISVASAWKRYKEFVSDMKKNEGESADSEIEGPGDGFSQPAQ